MLLDHYNALKMNAVVRELSETTKQSGHVGHVKVLSKRVDFSDGSFWEMGNLVEVLSVSFLWVRVKNLRTQETAKVAHAAIIW